MIHVRFVIVTTCAAMVLGGCTSGDPEGSSGGDTDNPGGDSEGSSRGDTDNPGGDSDWGDTPANG